MPKFPEPPPDAELGTFAPRPEETHRLSPGTSLWRVYFRGGEHPTGWSDFRRFGPTSSRFDHHDEPPSVQELGILYAAPQGPTCLAEVFQDGRTIYRAHRDPWLVEFVMERPVVLLDLAGPWITRAGASAAISSGPRPRSRRWSRAIYRLFPDIEGLLYSSSMHPGESAVALYERAENALPQRPATHRALLDPNLTDPISEVANRIGYAVV